MQIAAIHGNLCASYGQATPDVADTLQELTADGFVDFAALPVTQQASVIERVATNGGARTTLLEENPWIARSLECETDERQALIDANAAAVRANYSIEAAATALSRAYDAVLQEDTSSAVAPAPASRCATRCLSRYSSVGPSTRGAVNDAAPAR